MKHNWPSYIFKQVFDLRMGKTPSRDNSSYWNNGTNPWVAIADMGKGKYIEETKEAISDLGISENNMIPVPKDTVIMSFKLSIGKVAITVSPIFTNEAIMAFPLKPEFRDSLSTDFIFYYLYGRNWNESGKRVVMGKTLNKHTLSLNKIPIPPKKTQERIIAELDKINELIEVKREQLKQLDSLAQSLFYDTFGDPVTNPKGWNRVIVKDIANVKIGPFGSLLHKEDYISGGIPLVNPIHMSAKKILADKDFTISEDKLSELKAYILRTNDVIFGRRGDIGRCALVTSGENGYLCGTGSLFVRFKTSINPIFSVWTLSQPSIVKWLIEKAKGATMLNINCSIVENVPIICPPLALQQQFDAQVEAIEAQKATVEKSIAELQTLLDSRMDYWFN